MKVVWRRVGSNGSSRVLVDVYKDNGEVMPEAVIFTKLMEFYPEVDQPLLLNSAESYYSLWLPMFGGRAWEELVAGVATCVRISVEPTTDKLYKAGCNIRLRTNARRRKKRSPKQGDSDFPDRL